MGTSSPRPTSSPPGTVAELYASALAMDTQALKDAGPRSIAAVIRAGASAATWAHRARAPLATDTASLVAFVEQRLTEVLPSMVARDLGQVKWALGRSAPPAPETETLLADLQRGLHRMDAGRPVLMALPLRRRNMRRLLSLLHTQEARAYALLAWRTASRMADVDALTQESLTLTSRGEVLVVWFSATKGAQTNADTRPDHRIIVSVPEPEILASVIENPKPQQRLFPPRVRKEVQDALKALVPGAEEVARWRSLDRHNRIQEHYSDHSFKRGVAALAWEAAAEGLQPVAAVLHLLKHLQIASAIGYSPTPEYTARALAANVTALTETLPQQPLRTSVMLRVSSPTAATRSSSPRGMRA